MLDRPQSLATIVALLCLSCIANLALAIQAPLQVLQPGGVQDSVATGAMHADSSAPLDTLSPSDAMPFVQSIVPACDAHPVEAWGGTEAVCEEGGEGSRSCQIGTCEVKASDCSEGEYPCCSADFCGCAGGEDN